MRPRRKKRRSQVKIGAHTYKVFYAPTWEGADRDTAAEVFYDKGEIWIKDTYPKTEQFSALLHEVIHVENRTLNHELIDSLSEQLAQFLIDNKFVKI